MAEDLVLDARVRRHAVHPDRLPFIEWERTVNPGLGEGHGEKVVREKMFLFDSKGGPFVWVDPPNINYYLQKGWKIVGHGNLNFAGPDGQPIPQLEEVRPLIEGHFASHALIEAQRAELERRQAEIERQRVELERLRAEKAEADAKAAAEAEARAKHEAESKAEADAKPAADAAEGAKKGKAKAE